MAGNRRPCRFDPSGMYDKSLVAPDAEEERGARSNIQRLAHQLKKSLHVVASIDRLDDSANLDVGAAERNPSFDKQSLNVKELVQRGGDQPNFIAFLVLLPFRIAPRGVSDSDATVRSEVGFQALNDVAAWSHGKNAS